MLPRAVHFWYERQPFCKKLQSANAFSKLNNGAFEVIGFYILTSGVRAALPVDRRRAVSKSWSGS